MKTLTQTFYWNTLNPNQEDEQEIKRMDEIIQMAKLKKNIHKMIILKRDKITRRRCIK